MLLKQTTSSQSSQNVLFPHTHQIDVEKLRSLQNEWSRQAQTVFTLKIIQYHLSTNIAFFYKIAELEKGQKVPIVKGISMHFPSIPRCFRTLIFFLTKWPCVKRLTSPIL